MVLKLLLKRVFSQELSIFLHSGTPEVVWSLHSSPALSRALFRVLHSPLLLPESHDVFSAAVSLLPRLEALVTAATGGRRMMANVVANIIIASWSSHLRSAAAPNTLLEPFAFMVPDISDEKNDVLLFFSAWQPQKDRDEDGSDSDDDTNHLPPPTPSIDDLDPSLAARRLRRREFASAMSLFVSHLSQKGTQEFFDAVHQAQCFSDLPPLYLNVLRRFFSLLRLLLLDGLRVERNRSKASRLLKQVPSTVMNLLFRVADPITLAHLGARLSVKFKMPFGGNNLLQSVIRTLVDLSSTERKLAELRREIPSHLMKPLAAYALLVSEAPPALRSIVLEGGALTKEQASALTEPVKDACCKWIRLEIRRWEKQLLVDFGGSDEARFLMEKFVPILGEPLLSQFRGLGKEPTDFMTQIMASLEQLIAAIENPDMEEIERSIVTIERITFELIQKFTRHNGELCTTLFDWLIEAHSGGPEFIDLDQVLGPVAEEARQECRIMDEHWRKGGRTSAIPTPYIDSCIQRFQEALKKNATTVAEGTPAPPATPTKARQQSFLKRIFSSPSTPSSSSKPGPV